MQGFLRGANRTSSKIVALRQFGNSVLVPVVEAVASGLAHQSLSAARSLRGSRAKDDRPNARLANRDRRHGRPGAGT